MNSLVTFAKRLRDETATIEKEIESREQELEALKKRLEGLERATELLESEQAAILELLHTGTPDGGLIARGLPTAPSAKVQRAATRPKPTDVPRRPAAVTQVRGKTPTRKAARNRSLNGGLTRVDMMAAVLKRHPRRTVRELIVLLDKEYHWKTTDSAVTGKLYTRRDKFVHSPPDRAANRQVTWSAK